MVSETRENESGRSSSSKTIQNTPDPSVGHKSHSPSLPKAQLDGLYLIRQRMKNLGLSRTAAKIIMNSWWDKTRRQYSVYLRKYVAFCDTNNLKPFDQNEQTLVKFLTFLFRRKYGYSAINTARSAVSSVTGLGRQPLVRRFMRGVFNLRPTCPRYTSIWDVSVVIQYLRTLPRAAELKLHVFSAKLVKLLALVTGHRCQTLHAMDTKHMDISESKGIFHIASLLKTNSPKNPVSVITLKTYCADRRICVLTCLKLYLIF